MANISIDPELAFASRKRSRSAARVVDVITFAHAANLAQRSESLQTALSRTLHASGVEFFQLSTYRRSQFVGCVWSELAHSGVATFAHVDLPSSDAIACRVVQSGLPEIWDTTRPGVSTPIDDCWLKALWNLNISSGVTIAVHQPDDLRHVFHFGSQHESSFAERGGDLGVFSALAFITSQKLVGFERQSATPERFDALLSRRELEVLRWCKDGKSYPDIAQILEISTKTVEYHMSNAMRKLGVNQKVSAIVAAARQGLIQL